MNTVDTLDIEQVTPDFSSYDGRQIRIQGTLVIKGDDCYFTSQASPDQHLVDIVMPDLRDKLLGEASVRLGGPYLFIDPAVATGTLELNGTPTLKDLVVLTLTQGDNVHEFQFN